MELDLPQAPAAGAGSGKMRKSFAAAAKAGAAAAAPSAVLVSASELRAEAAALSSASGPSVGADAGPATSSSESNSSAAGGREKPKFPALNAAAIGRGRDELRSVKVPGHRYTPLKEQWETIVKPIVEHLKLQIRMNTKARAVEIKTSPYTSDVGALQKAEDFIKAFMLGFDVADAVALLRLDDLYVETFEVTDVKPLKGDHLGRAIGRIAGIGGKTKHAIENATRVRIVVADTKVHVLGAFSNIQVARDAICSLILGSPPGKVYHQMHQIASRMQQRF